MAPFQFLIIVRVPIVSVSVVMVTLPEANTAMATTEDVHVASSVQADQSCDVETVESIGQVGCPIDPSVGLMPPIPPSSGGFVLCIYAVTATAGLLHATADVIRAWRDQDRDP